MKIIIESELRDLVPGFLENRKKDCTAMGTLLKDSDFSTISRLGHNMKGTGAGYGFDKISEIGTRLENAAKSADADTIQILASELADYLQNLEIQYAD